MTICVFSAGGILLKSSLVALYLRIFRPSKGARHILYGSIIPIFVFYVTVFLMSIAKCAPVLAKISSSETYSDTGIPKTSHKSNIAQAHDDTIIFLLNALIATGTFSVVTDVYILIMPVCFIYNGFHRERNSE